MRPLVVLAAVLLAPAALSAQKPRTQVVVTVPGPTDSARARVLRVLTTEGLAVESSAGEAVTAVVPIARRDMGGRAGTRVLMQATLVPFGADSTRVVLAGRMLVPQAGPLAAEVIPVSDRKHRQYGKTNAQGWAAIERVAGAIR